MRRRSFGPVITGVLAAALSGCAPAAPTQSPVETVSTPHSRTSWTELPESPLSARRESAGAWVGDRFLIVGGRADQPCPPGADCDTTEPARRDGASFDPDTGTWQRLADAPVPVSGSNTAVVDGALYLLAYDGVSGVPPTEPGGGQVPFFMRYDLSTDAWTTLPSPPAAGDLVAAGDRVLAIPGSDENVVGVDSVFDPATKTWTPLPDDPLGPSFDRTALWVGGEVLLAAKDLVESPGADGPSLVRLATLDRALEVWTRLADTDIIGIGAVAAAGRVVFPFSGSADGGAVGAWDHPYANGGIYDPSARTWSDLPDFPDLPEGADLDEYANGQPPQAVGDSVLIGGRLVLDPVAGGVTVLPQPTWSPRSGSTVLTGGGTVLVWGGVTVDDDPTGANSSVGYLLRL